MFFRLLSSVAVAIAIVVANINPVFALADFPSVDSSGYTVDYMSQINAHMVADGNSPAWGNAKFYVILFTTGSTVSGFTGVLSPGQNYAAVFDSSSYSINGWAMSQTSATEASLLWPAYYTAYVYHIATNGSITTATGQTHGAYVCSSQANCPALPIVAINGLYRPINAAFDTYATVKRSFPYSQGWASYTSATFDPAPTCPDGYTGTYPDCVAPVVTPLTQPELETTLSKFFGIGLAVFIVVKILSYYRWRDND